MTLHLEFANGAVRDIPVENDYRFPLFVDTHSHSFTAPANGGTFSIYPYAFIDEDEGRMFLGRVRVIEFRE